MSNEEILGKFWCKNCPDTILDTEFVNNVIYPAMEECGKRQYNQAIDDASEVRQPHYHTQDERRESILKLKYIIENNSY